MRVFIQTLALVCQKGGAGKTTLSIHLAAEAAAHGVRTLLLDLDPQASAARWADRRKPGGMDIDVAVESPARLSAALQQAERDGYALMVLDTAPHADAAALQAARSADLVLVPVRCSILDLDAMGASLDLCTLARRPMAVVLNAAPIRSRVVEEATETVVKLGGEVASTIIASAWHSGTPWSTGGSPASSSHAAQPRPKLPRFTCKHANTSTCQHRRPYDGPSTIADRGRDQPSKPGIAPTACPGRGPQAFTSPARQEGGRFLGEP